MKLYNFKFVQNLYGQSLIITIDLGEFNNVDIYIDCQSTIKKFIKLMDSLIYYRDVEKINTKFIISHNSINKLIKT